MQKLFFQDNHVHSTYSDGAFSLEEIFEYNHTHDRLDLTLSDHVDMNTDWYPKYVTHLQELRKKYPDFNVRIGCEVKILDDGTLNTTDVILDAAEVILGSVHHFEGIKAMTAEALLEREFTLTKRLAQNEKIDVLAHPFNMGVRFHKSNPSAAQVQEVYDLCVANDIKFEYNYTRAPQSVHEFVKALVEKNNIEHLSFGGDMHTNITEIGQSGFKVFSPIPVLITGAGAGVGQSVIKAMKLSGVPIRIVMADNSPLAAGMYTGDAAYLVPKFKESAYIPRIIEICKKEGIKLIFAGTDIELEVLSEHGKEIQEAGAKVIVSNLRAVGIADDKWKTVEFLKENGFPYPNSCLVEDLPEFLKTAKFPLIVKPRVGARSIGLYLVQNQEELDKAVAGTPNAIIQEYLATDEDEYTCSGYFYEGECYGVLAGQRWLRNGDTYKALFKHDAELEKFIADVGAKLDLYGPCNFQLRKTSKGPVIFEINCRFSGTTGAMSYLGFNVANALVQVLCLSRPPSKLYFKESYMFRYWNEIFTSVDQVQLLSKESELQNPESETNVF